MGKVAALEAALDAFTVIRNPATTLCHVVSVTLPWEAAHSLQKMAAFKTFKWIVVDSLASTSVETEERQQYSPALTRSLPWRSQTCTVLSATLWTCAIVPRRVPHGEHLLAYPRLESMTQRCTRQIRDWKPPHDASPEATFKVSSKRSNWQEEARPRIWGPSSVMVLLDIYPLLVVGTQNDGGGGLYQRPAP